jgi:hypothetical protein
MEKQKAKKNDIRRPQDKKIEKTTGQSLGAILDKALKEAYDAKRR